MVRVVPLVTYNLPAVTTGGATVPASVGAANGAPFTGFSVCTRSPSIVAYNTPPATTGFRRFSASVRLQKRAPEFASNALIF